MFLTRVFIALLAAGLSGIVMLDGAGAQEYPSRTITFVVSFPAGGLSDTVA